MNNNSNGINFSKSENDLLQNSFSNENIKLFTKFIDHYYNYYNKTSNDIKNINLTNKLLYKDLENIIDKNNKLLFHFQISLILIFISIILNLYYLCFLILK